MYEFLVVCGGVGPSDFLAFACRGGAASAEMSWAPSRGLTLWLRGLRGVGEV
jgi:hypothetical protein